MKFSNILLITIYVMLLGCSNQDDVMFGPSKMSDQIECEFSKSISPESSEASSFINRIDGGVVVRPINISCVVEMYDKNELETWADTGDPVAIYAAIYSQSMGKNFCSNYQNKISNLNKSLSDRVVINDDVGSYVISRVPEAALAMASLDIRCAGGDGARYIDLAAKSGYDVHRGIGE